MGLPKNLNTDEPMNGIDWPERDSSGSMKNKACARAIGTTVVWKCRSASAHSSGIEGSLRGGRVKRSGVAW